MKIRAEYRNSEHFRARAGRKFLKYKKIKRTKITATITWRMENERVNIATGYGININYDNIPNAVPFTLVINCDRQ